MKKITMKALLLFGIACLSIGALAAAVQAGGRNICYKVTITNMTRGQVLTPVLVVTHKRGLDLFEEGEAAGDELAQLAEGGAVVPLMELLETMPYQVGSTAVAGDKPFGPGESVSIRVPVSRRYPRISLFSMAAVTNDGFIALNSVPAAQGVHTSPVYDAGSEENDELAENIPGTKGSGYSPVPGDKDEGFVHIHAGIHGIGDLLPENRDWRNPAAKIEIRFSHCNAD